LIVNAEVFELAKAVPFVIVPDMATRYTVGLVTEIAAGIVKMIRRVEPTTVVTAVACVTTALPPAVGVRLTVVFAGWIVPSGNPEPVRIMLETPGWPLAGAVAGVSVMAAVSAWSRL